MNTRLMHNHVLGECLKILIVLFGVVILLPKSLYAQADRMNLQQAFPVLEAENKVWVGTPNGLYQYDAASDSYKRFVVPVEQDKQNIRFLYYNEEWLWCVLDSSLAALHIRLNEWLVFTVDNGLPSSIVNGLDFTDDYVWAATENGAARFDMLIEEWEVIDRSHGIPPGPVKDVLIQDENVFMVFEHGFSEYHPEYEKWRHYTVEHDTAAILHRGFLIEDELWLITDNGIVRFDIELRSQQHFSLPFLAHENLIELLVEDDLIWVFTHSGMHYYDHDSGVWRDFEGGSYLKDALLVNSSVDQSEIWVLTDKNVLVWDRSEKTWEILDYSSGLTTSEYQSAYVNSGMAFLLNPTNIDYRLSTEDNWRTYKVQQRQGSFGTAGSQILKNLFDNEEGGYIDLWGYRLGFEGSRITRYYEYEQRYDSNGEAGEADVVTGDRIDFKSRLSLGKSRSISGFYNNIDYSETMYGIRYRSGEDELLREFGWGDFRLDPGSVPFGETVSMFGSNIWLQAGEKTPRYKRSLFTVKASTGERRSQKTYEHYDGILRDYSTTIADIAYTQNQFFDLPGVGKLVIPENIQIYVDDLNSSSNTPNTLVSETIAGITGDYDPLSVTRDFYFYDKGKALRLTSMQNANATIVVRYTLNNQSYEEVLQYNGTTSTARNNVYYLNAQEIIPFSFQFHIKTAAGEDVELAEFGLDDNGDGIIDSEWIDYERGILLFPEDEPFPAGVYDQTAAQSYYTMAASYRTGVALIQLENKNLVRGTETVKLDGVEAEGGSVYVLDYTNGTLVFVKDGIVTPETRIEIEYEYYLADNYTQLHNASVNYSPSDNLSVQTEVLNFENENEATTNLLKTHVEVREKIGDFDVKVTPGATYQVEENDMTAYHYEGVVSSSWLRLSSEYQHYDEQYQNVYLPQSVVGQVQENLLLNTSIDVMENIRISGSWNDTKGFRANDSTAELSDKNRSVSALFHHQTLPGYEITYSNTETDTDTSTIEKSYIQHKFEYQLPQQLLEHIPIKGLKLEGIVKTGERSGQELSHSLQQKYYKGYFRVNASLGEQFQGSLLYRQTDFMDNSQGEDQNKSIMNSERVLFNLSHEKWQLLQTNLRIENTLDSYDYPVDDEYDLSLNQYTQLNMRLSPGVLWSPLSPLFFEYNLNVSLNASGNSTNNTNTYLWSALPGVEDEFNTAQYLQTHYIKNELRPSANIYLYSLYEWNDQETVYDISSLKTNYWRLSEKLDIKVDYDTRISLQYKQYSSDMGNNESTSYYEPSIWIERRWSSNLQNIFYASYRNTDDIENSIQDNTHKIDGRYDIIYRLEEFLSFRRFELQQSFSGGHTRASGYNPANSYYVGSSTSMDVYPIHSLFFRLQLNLNYTENLENSDESYITTVLNLKMSLKL